MTDYSDLWHPLANLFPLIEGEEFDKLVADIKANGLINAIWTLGEKIIDGRNRYRACMLADAEIHMQELSKDVDPLAFVLSQNCRRRHLTQSQIGLAAAKGLDWERAEAAKRQVASRCKPGEKPGGKASLPEGSPSEKGKASEKAAKAAGVSKSTVENAAKVLDKGSAELIEAVEKGEIKVKTAARLSDLPPEEQIRRAKEDGRRAKKANDDDDIHSYLKKMGVTNKKTISAALSLPSGYVDHQALVDYFSEGQERIFAAMAEVGPEI